VKDAALIVKRPGHPDQRASITRSETLIGRSASCDVPLADESVSREHAVILWESDEFTVEDLQSTNGVRVNGKKVRTAVLQHGDEIQIGQTRILFLLGSPKG
jgi:pSer/pThr/pTyr-binding forkhead associated (FHA) protein